VLLRLVDVEVRGLALRVDIGFVVIIHGRVCDFIIFSATRELSLKPRLMLHVRDGSLLGEYMGLVRALGRWSNQKHLLLLIVCISLLMRLTSEKSRILRLVTGCRFTVGRFSQDGLILVHLTLSSVSLVHYRALIVDYRVAVVSREHLVSEIGRHFSVLVPMVGLLEQSLGRRSVLMRDDMVLGYSHVAIRQAIIVSLVVALASWGAHRNLFNFILVAILHLPLIFFLRGGRSARIKDFLSPHVLGCLPS